MKGYHTLEKEEKQAKFEEAVTGWKSKQEIDRLYQLGYTPSALFHIHKKETNTVWENHTWEFKGTIKKLWRNEMTASLFCTKLKQICPYSSAYLKISLKSSEWIKSGHLYESEEAHKKHLAIKSREGAKATQELRKTWEHYSPKNKASYYKDCSSEEAKEKAFQHRRTKTALRSSCGK